MLMSRKIIDFINVLLFSCSFGINENVIERQISFLKAYAVRNHVALGISVNPCLMNFVLSLVTFVEMKYRIDYQSICNRLLFRIRDEFLN